MQNVEKIGCVYKRVESKRKNPLYEKQPALKIPSADGTVLLRPLPSYQSAKPNGYAQMAKNNNGSSMQCSALHMGMGKGAYVGDKF